MKSRSSRTHVRAPGYHLPKGIMALYQPDGGFCSPERCIVAHVMAAQELGSGSAWPGVCQLGWEAKGQGGRCTPTVGATVLLNWSSVPVPEVTAHPRTGHPGGT